jgi:RNA polymerase sigma-70 factor (ECF subfamily)
MPDDAKDDELVRQVGSGGANARNAETTLCRRFAPRIRLYGLRHLRDEDGARDLVQTVLLGMLEATRAGRVKEPDRFERFVLGMCRNVVLRMRERGTRTQPVPDERLAEIVAEVAEAAELLDKNVLVRCFDALDVRAKKVLMLSFQDERSAEEIAAQLATTAGNVRVVRHRALTALRHCLDTPVAREASS